MYHCSQHNWIYRLQGHRIVPISLRLLCFFTIRIQFKRQVKIRRYFDVTLNTSACYCQTAPLPAVQLKDIQSSTTLFVAFSSFLLFLIFNLKCSTSTPEICQAICQSCYCHSPVSPVPSLVYHRREWQGRVFAAKDNFC